MTTAGAPACARCGRPADVEVHFMGTSDQRWYCLDHLDKAFQRAEPAPAAEGVPAAFAWNPQELAGEGGGPCDWPSCDEQATFVIGANDRDVWCSCYAHLAPWLDEAIEHGTVMVVRALLASQPHEKGEEK